jgi:hypothetical protein
MTPRQSNAADTRRTIPTAAEYPPEARAADAARWAAADMADDRQGFSARRTRIATAFANPRRGRYAYNCPKP